MTCSTPSIGTFILNLTFPTKGDVLTRFHILTRMLVVKKEQITAYITTDSQAIGTQKIEETKHDLPARMRLYAVFRRYMLVLYILILVLFITTLHVLMFDESISYSKFSYPLDMDFKTNYMEFKKNGRQSSLNEINPHPFQYIHFKAKCDFKTHGTTSLLILVKSAVNNFHLRDAIRATWGSTTAKNVEIVYLLAYRAEQQQDVDKEVALYGDIVQESFLDAYMNNTYKTIMGFNWAVKYCDQASHIVCVDDDHYLSIPNTLDYIDSLDHFGSENLMIGSVLPNSSPFRSRFSKWSISLDQYPFDKWPPYLAGAVYLLSKQVAHKMVFAFPYVKYIGIDDAYMGIVANKLDIIPQHDDRFASPPYLLYTNPKQIVYGEFKSKADFLTVHHILTYASTVKMCAFTWKCHFVLLI
ncbi:beta-1,3-galactosyltransferase brn-like [Pecten maximus]|uniref:beta-1,3-galactosyltransferase brn-like n=1 Tax=Pecten maximus TaxID=6579 RepID=UPI001458D138|nr:beta-1,3-galactosyltransferase brn-like [Pecten maximus]